jgi:hypothetical protein
MEIHIMTPFEGYEHDQERIEAYDAAQIEPYDDGATDAAVGISPTSQDERYLDGYFAALRQLFLEGDRKLSIRWLSPAYLSGGYDSRDEF